MSALYTALVEGETKERLALMVCKLREENANLRRSLFWINKVVRDAMPKQETT